jgi:hypothetical protein
MVASISNPSSKTYLVKKLNITNYSVQRVKMELLLILCGYFLVVDGSNSNLGYDGLAIYLT